MTASNSSTITTQVTGAAGAWGRVRRLTIAHPLITVFVLALAVRVFIVLVLSKYFSGTLVLDDSTYHFMAVQMAEGAIGSWDQFTFQLFYSTASFMQPVTELYRVFGPEPWVGQLFVALMGTLAAVFTTRIALEFLERKWALVAGVILALVPSQAFWSSMLMKDASVWFALTGLGAVVVIALRATGRQLALLAVPATGFLFMLSYLRLHTLVVAAWAMMIATFFGSKEGRVGRITGAVLIGISIPWVFGAIGPAGVTLISHHGSLEERRFQNAVGANTAIVKDVYAPPADGIPNREANRLEVEANRLEVEANRLEVEADTIEDSDPEEAERLRDEAQQVRDTVLMPPPSDSNPSLTPELTHLPRGLSVMLIEPLPIPFSGSLSLRLARLETIVWYPLLFLAAVGLWTSRNLFRRLAFPLLTGGAILFMYALSEGNVGTAHRHRGEFVWVVALLAAAGLAHLSSRNADAEPLTGS